MKRGYLFLALFLISVVSASPILNFQHEEITAGETIIGEITLDGEFTKNIKNTDMKFFEGRKEVFIESDIFYYNGTYYFYVYTNRGGNFSMKIENILFKENEVLSSTNIEKIFTVLYAKNNSKILSIKPGVVYLMKEPKIKLTNLGNSVLNISCLGQKIGLSSGQSKEVYYDPKRNFSYLAVDGYKDFKVPVIHTIRNDTFIDPSIYLKINPQILLENIYTEKSNKTIEILNKANQTISKIKMSSNLDFVSIEKIETLGAEERKNITIILNPKKAGHFQGAINISYMQSDRSYVTELPINFFILPVGSNTTFNISEESCEEKKGVECDVNTERCDNTSVWAKGAVYCCLGTCKKFEEESQKGNSWIYGVMIFLLIAVVGFMIYNKYKKTGPKNQGDALKEMTQKFESKK